MKVGVHLGGSLWQTAPKSTLNKADALVALALFQPEIPANTGTLMRLSACLDVQLHVIGPTAFSMDDKALRRAGMDYRDKAMTTNHVDYAAFEEAIVPAKSRLVLMTTKAQQSYAEFTFERNDVIIMGQESAGAPPWLHDCVQARLRIPMTAGTRSINMAVCASMVLGEALRQTRSFPTDTEHATNTTSGDTP
jgi:tRNA (cytidine/uridine-2'-O-)-methyltransferase